MKNKYICRLLRLVLSTRGMNVCSVEVDCLYAECGLFVYRLFARYNKSIWQQQLCKYIQSVHFQDANCLFVSIV